MSFDGMSFLINGLECNLQKLIWNHSGYYYDGKWILVWARHNISMKLYVIIMVQADGFSYYVFNLVSS